MELIAARSAHQLFYHAIDASLEHVMEYWDHTHARDSVRKILTQARLDARYFNERNLYQLAEQVTDDLEGLFDMRWPAGLWPRRRDH